MDRRRAPRVLIVMAVVTMVVSVIGFVVTLILNAFVLDEYDAYGEVPIPGSRTLQLPAGEATVSFHTYTTGSGGGLPVPPLRLRVVPPDGVADPEVTENFGTTTTVNNDAHVRVWVMQVPAEGAYRITADGEINGYISPRLAFGHGTSYGWVVWLFVGLFALAVVDLVIGSVWLARVKRAAVPPVRYPVGPAPPMSYLPTDDGVRLEQLKTLAALRDSGALTEAEFQAEKRRILEGR